MYIINKNILYIIKRVLLFYYNWLLLHKVLCLLFVHEISYYLLDDNMYNMETKHKQFNEYRNI